MASYNKANRKIPRNLYVPPFRNFTPTDYDEALSSYGAARRVEVPFSGGHTGGGSIRNFPSRAPSPRGGGGGGHHARFDPYRGPRNRDGGRHRKNKQRKHKGGGHDKSEKVYEGRWYKVYIPFGKKLGKDFILSSLISISTVPFIPINFTFEGNSAVFYVDNQEAERSLRGSNKRITTPNGSKMTVMVSHSPPPILDLNSEAVDNMKLCMNKRFNVDLNVLNLSNFHNDADLKEQGLFLPLNRHRVFETAVKIIKENIPQLEGLDLSMNRIYNINALSDLKTICVGLKSLNLKNNSFKNISELDSLKGFNSVTELILDGNLLCDQFKDKDSYISAIRDRMPNVIKLDGQDLPPPIVFDLGQSVIVPKTLASYFPSDGVKAIVLSFLESFFTCYDSNNRQNLLDAYHDDAFFSLSVNKSPKQSSYNNALQKYLSKSRNILKMYKDTETKYHNLKQGKVSIVATLNDLPPTGHDATSMTVDVAFASEAFMMFTVMGVFKESNQSKPTLLSFARTFIVVPAPEQRILIINDTLYISIATPEQMKTYKDKTPPSLNDVPNPRPSDNSDEQKQALVLQMIQVSRMNIPYATRCLEENEWNLEQAIRIFNDLKTKGVIPPEAF